MPYSFSSSGSKFFIFLQALQKRLGEVEKSTETLSERLDKAREENDDLRFQVSPAFLNVQFFRYEKTLAY